MIKTKDTKPPIPVTAEPAKGGLIRARDTLTELSAALARVENGGSR